MICMAACLLVCSLGSLLVKRDSGSRDPTTGSWAASRPTPIMKAAGARAITIRRFFIDVPPSKYLVMSETLQASPLPLAEQPSDAGSPTRSEKATIFRGHGHLAFDIYSYRSLALKLRLSCFRRSRRADCLERCANSPRASRHGR